MGLFDEIRDQVNAAIRGTNSGDERLLRLYPSATESETRKLEAEGVRPADFRWWLDRGLDVSFIIGLTERKVRQSDWARWKPVVGAELNLLAALRGQGDDQRRDLLRWLKSNPDGLVRLQPYAVAGVTTVDSLIRFSEAEVEPEEAARGAAVCFDASDYLTLREQGLSVHEIETLYRAAKHRNIRHGLRYVGRLRRAGYCLEDVAEVIASPTVSKAVAILDDRPNERMGVDQLLAEAEPLELFDGSRPYPPTAGGMLAAGMSPAEIYTGIQEGWIED